MFTIWPTFLRRFLRLQFTVKHRLPDRLRRRTACQCIDVNAVATFSTAWSSLKNHFSTSFKLQGASGCSTVRFSLRHSVALRGHAGLSSSGNSVGLFSKCKYRPSIDAHVTHAKLDFMPWPARRSFTLPAESLKHLEA